MYTDKSLCIAAKLFLFYVMLMTVSFMLSVFPTNALGSILLIAKCILLASKCILLIAKCILLIIKCILLIAKVF